MDHKEKIDLGGQEIFIAKDWENNLRTRNCQLGIVECLTTNNPLNLCLGDIVFVNHFTFHGDIGENRSFTLIDHVKHDGKLLFKVPVRNIYFKYNEGQIEPIGDMVIIESILTDATSSIGLELQQAQYKDRGKVVYAKDTSLIGKTVLVEKNALYGIEIKQENLFKVMKEEIAGIIESFEGEEEIFPTAGRVLLEDHDDEIKSSFIDLSMVKRGNTIKAKVIRCGELDKVQRLDEWIKDGDMVLRFRSYGVRFKDQVIVALADDNIHGVINS
ncbi:hypothetical protein [uncultured Clostridium sp.]|uniref:hypothetical protein n=1 Tax=uncultured Clostridium sp. TaxID=59620 RepID=UPI002617BA50|nr:hypothetical protein [uncultured Clostridium sp.]